MAKKSVKTRYEEECSNIFAFIGLPRIDQDEIEALKGITAVFLATGLFLLFCFLLFRGASLWSPIASPTKQHKH